MSTNSPNNHHEFNRHVERHDAHTIGGQILTPDHTIVTVSPQQRIRTGVDDRKRGPIDKMYITGSELDALEQVREAMCPYAMTIEIVDFSRITSARIALQTWMNDALQEQNGVCVISDFPTAFQGGVFQDVMEMEERHGIGARRILLTNEKERRTKAACDEYGIDRTSICTIRRQNSDDVRIQTDGSWKQKLIALFQG